MHTAASHAQFQTTQWSLIDAINAITTDGQTPGAPPADSHKRAREELARRYWPPVYAYLRRAGHTPDQASDLTQGFFADVVYPRELFEQADPSRGRLRNLLLAALKNSLKDAHRRSTARGGKLPHFSFDADREEHHGGSSDATPDQIFARAWAVQILREATRRCEAHFRAAAKPGHWAVFESRVLRPAIAGVKPLPLAAAAPEHGFARPMDAASAVQQVSKRLRLLLQEVVTETAATTHEQGEELQDVLALLRTAPD